MIFLLRFITTYSLLFAGMAALAAPSVDKSTLSFPPNSQTVTITNGSGKSDMPILIKPTISGIGSADFEIGTSPDLPCPSGTSPLDLGSQCKFTVAFKGTTGTSSATLTVSPDVPNLTVTLTGTAQNTVSKVTLNLKKMGAGQGTITSTPAGIDCGPTCDFDFEANNPVTLTATPDANSTFTEWAGGCSGNNPTCQVTMDAAKNVTATFTPNQPSLNEVSLNVTTDGSGKVKCNANDCQLKYPQNTPVTLIATPDSGFDFSKWSGDCTGTVGLTCTLPMSKSDNQVTAHFTPTPPPTSTTPTSFSLNLDKGNGEVKCNQGNCETTYLKNTTIALTAIPPTGFQFDGWSGDCTGKEDCHLLMDKDKTVKAMFIQQTSVAPEVINFPLTVNPTTGEVKCDGATCNPQYPQGTAVTLTAIPKPGNELANWEGCTPNTVDPKICVVTMDSAKIITAQFNPVSQPTTAQSFPLQVYLTGPGTGQVLCNNVECPPNQTYAANTPVTLTAVPTPGNTFTGWTGACTGNIVPCQLTMFEAKTVSATFELPPPPQPVMMIFVAPTCTTDSTSISDTCKGQGESLACNVTIEKSANISNVLFACDATNRGWIANSTIQTGATVTGGVFTGYITNQGTLADFEFLGASIIGGTLAGHIVNDSKVGGYFKDVHLAARAYITGGTLAGTLTGDCQAPATLENVKVKAGSHLSCVELGKKVKLEKNVTVEKGSD